MARTKNSHLTSNFLKSLSKVAVQNQPFQSANTVSRVVRFSSGEDKIACGAYSPHSLSLARAMLPSPVFTAARHMRLDLLYVLPHAIRDKLYPPPIVAVLVVGLLVTRWFPQRSPTVHWGAGLAHQDYCHGPMVCLWFPTATCCPDSGFLGSPLRHLRCSPAIC